MESNCESAHRPWPQLWCQQCFSSSCTATWRTRTCLRDACVRFRMQCLCTWNQKRELVCHHSLQNTPSRSAEVTEYDSSHNTSCSRNLKMKQNWLVRCLIITVNRTGAAIVSSCRGSQGILPRQAQTWNSNTKHQQPQSQQSIQLASKQMYFSHQI